MNTRITVDLKNPSYLSQLKIYAASHDLTLRDVIIQALDTLFTHQQENAALAKIANNSFAEWNNPLDQDYDRL